jgi:hypothetical protein
MRILDFLLMVISAGFGFLVKVIWDAQATMRKDFADLEKNLPKEYVRKVDLDRALDALTLSIHDMRDELRETIMREGGLDQKPKLKAAGIRNR